MTRTITFQGSPLTLAGRQIKVGMPAPDFNVTNQEMQAVYLDDFKERVKVISTFPSLDTPVCDLQVKEFNKRAAAVSKNVIIIGISKDLPFAQKRFCSMNEIKNETVLSDYKTSSFGINYGLLIKELNLLARAVLIIDSSNIIRYLQIAPEITKPLDYDNAVRAIEDVMKNPGSDKKSGVPSKCVSCEGGIPPLSKEEIEKSIAVRRGWTLVDGKKITKELKFRSSQDAKYILDIIAAVSEEQGHHPTLTLIYDKLKVTLTTHSAGGLTVNDFVMAGIIDDIEGGTK